MNGHEDEGPPKEADPHDQRRDAVLDDWADDSWDDELDGWAEGGWDDEVDRPDPSDADENDDNPSSHQLADELEPWDVSVPEGATSGAPPLWRGRYTDVMIAGETPDVGWEPLDPWARKSTSAAIPFRTASGRAQAVVLLTVDARQEVTRYFSYATDEHAQAVARLLDPVEPPPPDSPDLVRKEWFVDPRTCQKHLDQAAR